MRNTCNNSQYDTVGDYVPAATFVLVLMLIVSVIAYNVGSYNTATRIADECKAKGIAWKFDRMVVCQKVE